MNRVCICVIFFTIAFHATAQSDTANKSTANHTSIVSQIKILPANTSVMSHGYFWAFPRDVRQIPEISIAPFRYNYLSNKVVSSNIINLAGAVFLSYLGDKTFHRYYSGPYNLIRQY